MFAKLHLLSQDQPEGGGGLRWRAHPYLRMVGSVPRGPVVFDWNPRQRADLEALWRDSAAEGPRERLAKDLAAFCDDLGWTPDPEVLADAEKHGDEYLVTISAVPPELYILPWEAIQVGASGTYLSDYESAQVRYAVPGIEPRAVQPAPPAPGVLFAWSAGGGEVPHEDQAAAIRAAAEAGGAAFHELAEVDEGKLQAALDAGPPSVLHLLCHGSPGPDGEPPRLTWGASDNPSAVTATRLARMLRHHSGAIRLVVLSACGSGDGHGDPLFMGSMAQELHKKGIPDVVASRYPLSVPGSRALTRMLYDRLLREAWSLERSLRHTREALLRVGDDGESHPGDAYGIQLYASDTEHFISDNTTEAVRPVLSSYPFGTAARPVPAKAPPRAELTLHLDSDPGLSRDQLADKLRHLSEDETLAAEPRPEAGSAALSVIVHTTVDGAQRLLGAWRSKVLRAAVGVIVGELILTKGGLSAMASPATAAGNAAGPGRTTGQQAASSANATASGQAASAASTATTGAVIAGTALAVKLAIAAVIGTAAVVGGGVAVYRARIQPPAPVEPAAAVAAGSTPALAGPAPDDAAIPADAAGDDAAIPADAAGDDAVIPADAAPDAALALPGPPLPVAPSAPRPVASTAPASIHVKLAFTLMTGAPATMYRSRNYGQVGTGTAVGFVVPPQAGARGPASIIWNGVVQPTRLTVSARDRSAAQPQELTLRGFKPTACGNNQMNSAALCGDGKEESVLALTILDADNASVPAGEYTGSFRVEAQRAPRSGPAPLAGPPHPTLVEVVTFDYTISIEREPAPPYD